MYYYALFAIYVQFTDLRSSFDLSYNVCGTTWEAYFYKHRSIYATIIKLYSKIHKKEEGWNDEKHLYIENI